MSSGEPKWRIVERVVALLEQSLSPAARVKHDVYLPDRTLSNESRRQCDVVIWSGQPPRETITIVEVQDRNQRVDINTFDGWCRKMERVGAQHLICVSTTGFPRSVKEEALRRGPTVRLVTLQDLEESDWPISFVDSHLEYLSLV